MVRWQGGEGEGGADGALQFYSEGFSKGGIPGMNFNEPHIKMTYIAGAYYASLNFAYAPETSESEHCDK